MAGVGGVCAWGGLGVPGTNEIDKGIDYTTKIGSAELHLIGPEERERGPSFWWLDPSHSQRQTTGQRDQL